MEFSSLEDLVSYVEKMNSVAMYEVGEEMKDIMKDETHKQVYQAYSPEEYQRTYDLMNSIDVVSLGKDFVETEFQDNGGWYSVKYGSHFHAIKGLEDGATWGRSGTNLMSESESRIESEIPREYKKIMNGLGVPMK